MKITIIAILTLMLTFGLTFGPTSFVFAQSPGISTGVVAEVETSDDGALTGFSILGGDGNVQRFTVSSSNPNTSFGLENRVGDRWVSDLATDSREAVSRLRDQQKRLTQISVQSDTNGVAISVVQAESRDVSSNLGYLFAVVAIAWVGIAAYVVYLGVRQRTLAAELNRLRGDNGNDEF